MAFHSKYVCQQCGYESTGWMGKCPECGTWNSLVETVVSTKSNTGITSKKSITGAKTIKLSDIKSSATKRISTKISELDRVLGGGLVPGQVVLIAGEPGIGKCVAGDTFVPTVNGLEQIKNLQPKNARTGFSKYKIGVQSITGKEFTNQFYRSGLQLTKSLQTRMGYKLQATYEHPVLTLTTAGEKKWKTMKELNIGDYIAIQRHGQIWGKETTISHFDFKVVTNAITPTFPDKIDKEMAYCLGLLVGDGGLTDFGHVNLTTADLEISETFENWIRSLGLKIYHLPKGYRLSVNNRAFHLWLQHIGMKLVLSINKSIPSLILKAPKEIVTAFLQGLFDTDGSTNTNPKGSMPGVIEFCSASEQLAHQVHLLLLQFGIVGKLRYRKNNKHGAWVIGLLGDNARLFYENIGFRLSRKQSARKLLSTKNNNNLDVIPYLPKTDPLLIPHEFRSDRRYLKGLKAPSYEKLESISKFVPEIKSLLKPNFYWDSIKNLARTGAVECYDLCLPKSHSFISNGIVSHNSTLLTQISDKLGNVLYVCGEESASQVAVRAKRLAVKNKGISLLENTDVDSVVDSIEMPDAIIVDSIQTMTTSDLSGMAGSVGQVRECAFRLLKAAKERGVPLFLVGHVTKEGTVAGPAVLAHIVDTVLWFEGDKTLTTRVLRAVKNRFGPTDEVGVFEMQDMGLMPIADLEKAFLEKGIKDVSGSIVTSVMQGTRPLLVEIQALVVPTKLAIPRRTAQGIDSRRLELLLAVLTRRCGLPLYDFDVFVNIAGGLKVTEPASDLAICLAVASSYFDKSIPGKTIAVGEVGLLGEVREVVAQDKRIKEAKRMGFTVSVSSREYKFVNQAIKTLFK